MKNRVTPENITELAENEVFVFGSNTAGRHGAGAAKLAHLKFGARWREGHGWFGQSFAIPTKGQTIQPLSLDEIRPNVEQFLIIAKNCPHIHFLVTAIGCGLAGYTAKDIAPMFKDAPENVSLPQSFWDVLGIIWCQRCENQQSPGRHSCPYAEEIGDNNDTNYCNCCNLCRQDCIWEI